MPPRKNKLQKKVPLSVCSVPSAASGPFRAPALQTNAAQCWGCRGESAARLLRSGGEGLPRLLLDFATSRHHLGGENEYVSSVILSFLSQTS